MTEHDAMIAAILSAPADDSPRLVYADWLDEHDQHERAEFVRVQIALAALKGDGHCPKCRKELSPLRRDFMPLLSACAKCGYQGQFWADAQEQLTSWATIRRRERELLLVSPGFSKLFPPTDVGLRHAAGYDDGPNQNTYFWATDSGTAIGVRLRRGFVNELVLSWTDWLKHHAALFWSPRQTVECENCAGDGEITPRNSGHSSSGPCPDCGGKWNSGPFTDPDDYYEKGTGRVPRPFPVSVEVECDACKGQGFHHYTEQREFGGLVNSRSECNLCSGTGRITTAACPQPLERVTLTTWPEFYAGSIMLRFDERAGPAFDAFKRFVAAEWEGLEFTLPQVADLRGAANITIRW